MILSLDQIRAIAASVGFPDPAFAAAVAMAESGGDMYAQGDPRGPFLSVPNGQSTSFGLWQIHTPTSPQYDATRLLQDPTYNAQAAFAISRGGTYWTGPWWTTISTGSYQQYLPQGYAPPPQPYVEPFARVTPPARSSGVGSTMLATVGGLALTAAAGFAAYLGRQRREEPEPLPWP